MKMPSRCCAFLVSLVLPVASTAIIDSGKTVNSGETAVKDDKAGRLRGQHKGDPAVQSITSHYFGLNFDDSYFSQNPWTVMKSAVIVEDMDPTAPRDRMDRVRVRSISGSAPVAPGKTEAEIGYTQPDFISPYLHPKPFPQEDDIKQRDGIMIPIEDRMVVAHEDRLRENGRIYQSLYPLASYPLTAPASRIRPGPHAVVDADKVPGKYDKFFDQTFKREQVRQEQKRLSDAFARVDADDDNAISNTEWKAEVEGRQKKTEEQADILWKQYHEAEDPDMTRGEFEKVARTGFDLGQKFVDRTDMSAVLKGPPAADLGFWGGGAACPAGKFVKGVQMKVKANANTGDNTAVNCVKFKCEDGSEIQTAEGPDGDWTKWAECLEGQTIYAVSVRIMEYHGGQDNSGINDLSFQCRSSGHEETTKLKFGKAVPPAEQTGYVFVNGEYVAKNQTDVDDKAVVVGDGTPGDQGGWSQELDCGTNSALCGAQGRLYSIDGNKDNMGITDFRFFCCSKPVLCTVPCANPTSTDCLACKQKESKISR